MSLAFEPRDEHDRLLVERVHPPGWVNPVPERRYNLVVLGGGPAGLVCAVAAAGLGARVALVEKALLGGDCLNVGCVPSKALLAASRRFRATRGRAAAFDPDGFRRAMGEVRCVRAGLAAVDSAARLRDLGIDVFLGEGHFAGEDAVEVAGARLAFRRAVIATGARSALPPIPGLAEAAPLTNETVFGLTELPRRIGFIGAGAIGCELGQALRGFGAEVGFVSLDPGLVPRDDPDAAAVLERRFRADGIRLELGARVVAVERRGAARVVHFERGGERGELAADELFVSIGRTPNVEGLGLERAEIEWDRSGVRVDDRLRTTNPRVWAAGDVCFPLQFTHAADAQARLAIANALFYGRGRASRLVIPWVTYTEPEIAHVGLTPAEIARRGVAVDTLTVPLTENDRSVLEGEAEGFARVHLASGRDRILGATLVAPHAGEALGEIVLAMTRGLGLRAVGAAVHAYPTRAAVWQRLADRRNRERLTPRIRSLLEAWLRLTRR